MRWFLSGWLRRRNTRRTIELDPLDQYLLVALLQGRERSFRSLHARVEPESHATAAQTVLALAKLEGEGLICRQEQQSEAAPRGRYNLTPPGRKVARFLPSTRRSRIEVRL